MKRVSEEELKSAGKSAKASLEFEGFHVTPEDDELVSKRLRKEISHEEFVRLAKEQARKECQLTKELAEVIAKAAEKSAKECGLVEKKKPHK